MYYYRTGRRRPAGRLSAVSPALNQRVSNRQGAHMSPTFMVKAPSTGGMETHRPEPWWFTCCHAYLVHARVVAEYICATECFVPSFPPGVVCIANGSNFDPHVCGAGVRNLLTGIRNGPPSREEINFYLGNSRNKSFRNRNPKP